MTAPHLAAHDLACRRGDRVLFRGVGFALEAGQALHLAGANGIGKSSLIRILAGLMRPFAGSVERAGNVALVDERLALDPHQPLGRALAFWHAIDRTVPTRDDPFGLADLADVPVRYLSTGQKKRAALARLAAAQAPIWLLDEPLNGLDTAWAAKAQAAIEGHRQAGGVVVIASHQPLALAGVQTLAMADHVPAPQNDDGDGDGDWA
ncbi:UNVERIFIED_ORG: heme exporter protein A [Sphingomonas sp. R1F5B]